jgi:hypothetical protein
MKYKGKGHCQIHSKNHYYTFPKPDMDKTKDRKRERERITG